jgi:hypothetical protein
MMYNGGKTAKKYVILCYFTISIFFCDLEGVKTVKGKKHF